jgi:hypothetical protein
MSYRNALKAIAGNIPTASAFASRTIPKFFLLQKFNLVHKTVENFKNYMAEMVDSERTAYPNGKAPSNATLMASLIRDSEDARH